MIMEEDIRIQEGLLQRLKEHPKLDTSHMELVVKDAVAFLKGRADTEEEKKLAESIAESYPGVKSVKNELHIGAGIIYTITSLVSGLSASNDHELHKDK
jgi:osmotically-inducible protein OsmY